MAVTDDLATRPPLHMTRVFDAPRPLVWMAWTRPEMAVQWMGPVEWPAVSATQDFRVGGEWRKYVLSKPEWNLSIPGMAVPQTVSQCCYQDW